jgi:hypothetical protein
VCLCGVLTNGAAAAGDGAFVASLCISLPEDFCSIEAMSANWAAVAAGDGAFAACPSPLKPPTLPRRSTVVTLLLRCAAARAAAATIVCCVMCCFRCCVLPPFYKKNCGR